MDWKLGPLGHFTVIATDPQRSAAWWVEHFGLSTIFERDGVSAVGNDAFRMVLRRGTPAPAGHMAFQVESLAELQAALASLRAGGVDLEDPGDEIGPVAPGSPNLGLWFHDPDGHRWELIAPGPARED
jgi:catechol 2,3-dioxygenase-like lactoylglutathione lyase family enzyme